MRETALLGHGARLVRVARDPQETVSTFAVAGPFLAQSQALTGTPWTLTVFSHVESVDEISAIRAAVAGISTLLLGILAGAWFVWSELRRRSAILARGHELPLWVTLVRVVLFLLVIGYVTWLFGSGRPGTSFPIPGLILADASLGIPFAMLLLRPPQRHSSKHADTHSV